MRPTFVMTSTWWIAAPPLQPWGLVVDVHQWPNWWRSVRGVAPPVAIPDTAARKPLSHEPGLLAPLPAGWMVLWRVLMGWPLHLQVLKVSQQAGTLFEIQVTGDLNARATWLFSAAKSSGAQAAASALEGTDVTCRWEMESPAHATGQFGLLVRLLAERHHFSRMRACARDMGKALGCAAIAQGEWSGAWRN
jgi:hypothetical protein